jgi:hypothetical protein
MPFRSKAQQRFLYATHPDIAARWEDHTPDIKGLPDKVNKAKEAAKKLHKARKK